MQRRHLMLCPLALLAPPGHGAPDALQWRERRLLGLGTTLHLRAAHADAARADAGLDAAVSALRAVEASMSLFRADSEVSRLNRDGRLEEPSPHLLRVLQAAQGIARRSAGAFDVTVQPLWSAYDQARQSRGGLPSVHELARARAQVDWTALEVQARRVRFTRAGMAITLNGIAQGYAADLARDTLQAHGIRHALIDAGEWSLLGHNAQDRAWTLGIEDPHDEARVIAALRTDGRSVATSADNRSAFSADHRHHHIFDPATGDSPPELSSVTVVAASAMQADALTKVMFVAGPARIAELARAWGVGALWVDKAGRWSASPDLKIATAASLSAPG